MPFSSSTRTAWIVVPAGEHTISLSSPGCFPVSRTIFALPSTAWAANVYAWLLGMPPATAASAIASININTYAGELPLTAVTTSISFSSIISAFEKPEHKSSTVSSSDKTHDTLPVSLVYSAWQSPQSVFSASPCIVIKWLLRTPIAQILRSFFVPVSSHTPVAPATLPDSIPYDAQTLMTASSNAWI